MLSSGFCLGTRARGPIKLDRAGSWERRSQRRAKAIRPLFPVAGTPGAFPSSCETAQFLRSEGLTFWRWITLFRTPEAHRANYFFQSAESAK